MRSGEANPSPRGSLYSRLAVPGAAATDHVRSASIDVIRGTAALGVLFGHAFQLGGGRLPRHGTGATVAPVLASTVNLFFAVSAFLIAGPFLRALLDGTPLPAGRRYAIRRAARILPAYWVAFGAILLTSASLQVHHWWQIPVHALLLQSVVPGESSLIYFVAWTLGLEAVFYLLVPVVASAIRRRVGLRPVSLNVAAIVFLGLWAVAAGAGVALGQDFNGSKATVSYLALITGMGAFCPGLLVYLAHSPQAADRGGAWRGYRRLIARPAVVFGLAGTIWLTHAIVVHGSATNLSSFGSLIWVVSGLVLAGVLAHGRLLAPVFPVLATAGLISYGLYLWHWVVNTALRQGHVYPFSSFSASSWVGNAIVLLVLTIPLALASWLYIERPLLMRTTMWDRPRPEPGSSRSRVPDLAPRPAPRSVPDRSS
jgi:peptidoglycan/LPS O-acetylase OafA/YrhL